MTYRIFDGWLQIYINGCECRYLNTAFGYRSMARDFCRSKGLL